jgi:FtsZ-interacting cell division protein ZipA
MSTGAIIAIVIGVLILLALIVWVSRRSRTKRLESRRHEAREIRSEAEVRTAEADKMSAEAEERAARARREDAEARAQAARAEEQRREAESHHARAHDLDPDTKGDYEPDRDRTAAATPGDAQYERPTGTTTPAADPDATVREEHDEERRREYH